ncbi:hypothetical protein [Nocardia sp. NBC_01388]
MAIIEIAVYEQGVIEGPTSVLRTPIRGCRTGIHIQHQPRAGRRT